MSNRNDEKISLLIKKLLAKLKAYPILLITERLAPRTAKDKKMSTTLTLSEVAEKNITDFEQDDFKQFQIGELNNGQIRCYYCDGIPYIALINPQDENHLWFADEFPYDWFNEYTQNAIDQLFEGLL